MFVYSFLLPCLRRPPPPSRPFSALFLPFGSGLCPFMRVVVLASGLLLPLFRPLVCSCPPPPRPSRASTRRSREATRRLTPHHLALPAVTSSRRCDRGPPRHACPQPPRRRLEVPRHCSHSREVCHCADALSPSRLIHPLKVEGGAAG